MGLCLGLCLSSAWVGDLWIDRDDLLAQLFCGCLFPLSVALTKQPQEPVWLVRTTDWLGFAGHDRPAKPLDRGETTVPGNDEAVRRYQQRLFKPVFLDTLRE
jgi:hypothetical protein